MAVLEAHMAVGGLFVAINVVVAIWGVLDMATRATACRGY